MRDGTPALPQQIRNLQGKALALCGNGRWVEALPLLRKSAGLEPDDGAILNNLGVALWQSGNLREAETVLTKALERGPGNPSVWLHSGEVLCARGDWRNGADALERGMSAVDDGYLPLFQPKLALAFRRAGKFVASERIWRYVTEREPGNMAAWNSLGMAQSRLGKTQAAVRTLTRLGKMSSCPARYHSNLLLTLLTYPSVSPQYIWSQHRRWAIRHSISSSDPPPAVGSSRRKRIRIGYVSADFRDHSVRYFIEPLLRHHDRSRFDVHIFADNRYADAVTTSLARREPAWHNIHSLDDEAAAQRIRKLDIDILVDLSGHTGRNRLGVFARKPARVQAAYLGYPATTGLAAIDFRLTDSFADPPGQTQQWHSEQLVRVEPCFLAYAPPTDAPMPMRQGRPHVAFAPLPLS